MQEEDDGEGPEDTRFICYTGTGDVNKDNGNKWKIVTQNVSIIRLILYSLYGINSYTYCCHNNW